MQKELRKDYPLATIVACNLCSEAPYLAMQPQLSERFDTAQYEHLRVYSVFKLSAKKKRNTTDTPSTVILSIIDTLDSWIVLLCSGSMSGEKAAGRL